MGAAPTTASREEAGGCSPFVRLFYGQPHFIPPGPAQRPAFAARVFAPVRQHSGRFGCQHSAITRTVPRWTWLLGVAAECGIASSLGKTRALGIVPTLRQAWNSQARTRAKETSLCTVQ